MARQAKKTAVAVLACTALALLLVQLSSAPAYEQVPTDAALIRLSMTVAGTRIEPCRELTPDEIARLAANMRTAQACPRERADVRVLLWINDAPAVDALVSPRGVARDGSATLYRRIVLPAGQHRLRVAVNEDGRQAVFHHDVQVTRALRPGQVLIVDFDREAGGVQFR